MTSGSGERLETAGLLEECAARGHAVTDRALELWRNQDLLPRPTRTEQIGTRPVWTYPASALDQLGALLDLRGTTKDPNVLRAALWFAGYAVPTARVRSSAAAFFRNAKAMFDKELIKQRLADTGETDARTATIDKIARKLAGVRRGGLPRHSRQPLDERAQAIALMLRLFFDEPVEETTVTAGASAIEQLMGIDRGRKFTVAGSEPWLSGPPSAGLHGFAKVASISALIEAAESATDAEFEAAREIARTVVEGIGFFSRMADAQVGRTNAAGMAGVEAGTNDPAAAIWLTSLFAAIAREPDHQASVTEIVKAIMESTVPMIHSVRELVEASKESGARIEANIRKLPFKEQGQITRVIATFGQLKDPDWPTIGS